MADQHHRVQVDHSEGDAVLLKLIRECGAFDVQMVRLAAGDYLIDDEILVERKTMADFSASLIDGRLFPQAFRLAHSPHRSMVLIEGPPAAPMPDVHPHAIQVPRLVGCDVALPCYTRRLIPARRAVSGETGRRASSQPAAAVRSKTKASGLPADLTTQAARRGSSTATVTESAWLGGRVVNADVETLMRSVEPQEAHVFGVGSLRCAKPVQSGVGEHLSYHCGKMEHADATVCLKVRSSFRGTAKTSPDGRHATWIAESHGGLVLSLRRGRPSASDRMAIIAGAPVEGEALKAPGRARREAKR